jgi:hypothetical protein
MHRIASLAFSKSHISSIWAVLFTTNITTKPPFEMPPPETSARPVYLISFPAVRGEYSQWAFFVPHTGDDQGKYFNAVNTPSTGFAVEIEADKDLSRTNRQFTKNLLGYVSVNDSVLEDLANRTTPLGISPADLQPVSCGFRNPMWCIEMHN